MAIYKQFNRARMFTATTGTGTITLGSAVSRFATFAEAGVSNGDTVTYTIDDGADFEIGRGTYTSSGTTLSRDAVLLSKIGGVAGTSKINLSGAATVFLTAAKEDIATLSGTNIFTNLQTITIADANMGVLASSGYSLTGSNATSLIDLAGTWNTSGTPTALKLNITDTASNAASLLMDLQVGGTSQFNVSKAGLISGAADANTFSVATTQTSSLRMKGAALALADSNNALIMLLNTANSAKGFMVASNFPVGWSSTASASTSSATTFQGTVDLQLWRDAANTLAQRNGTNAQTLRVYNTWTDASNGEWAEISWGSNIFHLFANKNGTGSYRSLRLNEAWDINNSGHLLAIADNTYDIGAGGATRPRDIYVGSNFVATNVYMSAAGFENQPSGVYKWTGASEIRCPADGIIKLANAAQNDFGRLQFGGTSSSFPALKRSTTNLQVRLADDSAYAPLAASRLITPLTSELTIATGAITVTAGYHTVDTESDAASDDLDTISGGADGALLVLRAAHTDRTVVVKDGTGNIQIAGDMTLDNTQDTITLIFDNALSSWLEIGRAASGA